MIAKPKFTLVCQSAVKGFLAILIFCSSLLGQTPDENPVRPSAVPSHTQKRTVQDVQEEAEQGDAKAQAILGLCYLTGKVVKKDISEAVKWFRKAGEQGIAQSQHNLGVCYTNGMGVDQNHVEAVKWYRKAAEQGYSRAQFNLGHCYYLGDGIHKNYVEAIKWYRRAAEQGLPSAQYSLALEGYARGNGVAKNPLEAYVWFSLAAANGFDEANQGVKISSSLLKPKDLEKAQRRFQKLKAEIKPDTDDQTLMVKDL